jgi:hypothetical protein
MSENELSSSINEYGQVIVDMRNFCNFKCVNLTDTHEVTLAEKNCFFNCFKKMNYAYNNFNRMTNQELTKLGDLKEPNQEFRY